MAIFSANPIPVAIMGITLGIGKIVGTIWLKQNWKIAPLSIKIYLLTAISILVLITSLGIFGLLSKAHSDQSLVSGDALAKLAVFDEKIKTEKENIDANRKALKQLDEAVDQVMGRSTTETGARRAVQIRRSQQEERGRLLKEIAESQQRITALNEARAPIAAEVRKIEAEVGPIKYIAALVYGETDTTVLEKAVTWVIMLIVVVFDPLAVILLLASQISFQNFRKRTEASASLSPAPALVTGVQAEPAVEVEPEEEPAQVEVESDPVQSETILDKHPYLFKPFPHFPTLTPVVSSDFSAASTTTTEPVFPLSTATDGPLFVQNEEQTISDRWSRTLSITHDEYLRASNDRRQKYLDQVLPLIRSGQLDISDIPESMQPEVKSRI